MTARLRELLRRAWIPLALLVVVATLTAVTSHVAGPVDQEAATQTTGSETSAQRRGGAGQRGGGRGAASGLPRDARTWPWWRDEEVKKELGLSDEKSAEIERIYENRANRMRPFASEFMKEEAILDRMVRERVATPEAFEMQASKVESLTAELRKSRWVMLYRLYRELEPEQYQQLREIRDRRFNRGRGSGNR